MTLHYVGWWNYTEMETELMWEAADQQKFLHWMGVTHKAMSLYFLFYTILFNSQGTCVKITLYVAIKLLKTLLFAMQSPSFPTVSFTIEQQHTLLFVRLSPLLFQPLLHTILQYVVLVVMSSKSFFRRTKQIIIISEL
jgi:hypothetical protein